MDPLLNDSIVNEIKLILDNKLPIGAYKSVSLYKDFMGGENVKIVFAVSHYNINGVSGQKVQCVSMTLDLNSLELKPQVFGGNGGQSITRKPNKDIDSEKYLAMKSVKIPFRKPKCELQFIYSAIEKFCLNWLKALKENKDQLTDSNLVDYDKFLTSY